MTGTRVYVQWMSATSDLAHDIVPADLALHCHGITHVATTLPGVVAQIEFGICWEVDVDAARTGLQFPSSCLFALHVDSAAPRIHPQAAANACSVNRSAPCGCIDITFDVSQRNAS